MLTQARSGSIIQYSGTPDRTFGVLGIADRRLERPDRTLTLLRLGLKFLDLGKRESSTTNDRFQWDFANDRSSLIYFTQISTDAIDKFD
jgi:hypothetical protein